MIAVYKKSHIPSSKELHAMDMQARLHLFKLNDQVDDLKVDVLSGFIERKLTDTYHKKPHHLAAGSRIDVITKNGKYDSFAWHASPEKIKQGVRHGIVSTYSVTGKVISALGKYRLSQLQRIKDGYISNRYAAKSALLDLYQDRFEALAATESLANRHISSDEYIKVFNEYIAKLQSIKQSLGQRFKSSHADYLEFVRSIDQDIARAVAMSKLNPEVTTTRSTGLNSVLTFVKTQMIRNLREMQYHNQSITYDRDVRFALTRGELNSCIEDAELVIEKHAASPGDVIDPVHHGDYSGVGDVVVYDSHYHCHSAKDQEKSLLAISFIEKLHDLDLSDQDDPMLIAEPLSRDSITVSQSTNWKMGSFPVAMKTIGAWFANIAIKLVVGVIEFPLTVFIEPLTFGIARPFFEGVRELAVYEIKVNNPHDRHLNLQYAQLTRETSYQHESFGMRIRHFAENAFRNSIRNIAYALHDVGKDLTVHLFDSVMSDYSDGERSQNNLNDVIDFVENEIQGVEKDRQDALNSILNKVNSEDDLVNSSKIVKRYAMPDYIPNAGDDSDPLNSLANGIEFFAELFNHTIYAKHPFGGFVFSAGYVMGMLVVLSPASVAFLGKEFIAGSQGVAFGMAKDPVTAAIALASTQGELLALAYESAINGTHGWMAANLREFEKDPFTSAIYVGTALLLGHIITYQLNIPWLSEELKSGMGTVPASSLPFVSGKLGLGVYELLKEEESTPLERSDFHIKLQKLLVDIAKESKPNISDQELQVRVKQIMEALGSHDKLTALKKRMVVLAKDIDRASMILFMVKNAANLPYVSARGKHALFKQLKQNFSFQEAQSLKQLLYPHRATSILRNLVGMVVGYPASLLRLLCAIPASLIHRNMNPLRSASLDFGIKILHDVDLIARAASKIVKVSFSTTRRMLKTVGDILMNSISSRIEAIVTGRNRFANFIYNASAWFDCKYEQARQFFSMPVDAATKVVTPAQPASTYAKSASTYAMLGAMLTANFQQSDDAAMVAAPRQAENISSMVGSLQRQDDVPANESISMRY